ncbi:MAG: hypothetical protein SFU91_05835 [Chloroherpetonaceae bacterium]|nr:hypothetical protein [Chloroherpetonaceae bacterium]
MNKNHFEIVSKHFGFLLSKYNFKIKEIIAYDYALYAKFSSSTVGVYIIYEFREKFPQIQFSNQNIDEFEIRPGIYTIKEFFKKEDYQLQTFYLDEIIKYKIGKDYKDFFKDVKTVEDSIKISAALTEEFASDFIVGEKSVIKKMNLWFKEQLN